ncbi:U3 small nucleolar RNA-associated protein 18 homolog [Acanthaster planci]|uniref:U3 small nucleolar RNA-associated protein 18 homolog n=1 Tax=Acanthaster planci TaxID=133434 RepID=A0A8B7XZ55_ACAPL|nr:U3 small nucleolar RNA-associated protein 18 homolog [Acanthaster planci]
MLRRAKKRSVPSEDRDISSLTTNSQAKHVELRESVEDKPWKVNMVNAHRHAHDHDEKIILGMPSQKQDSEEAFLEKFVLGGQESFVENLERGEKKRISVLDAEQRKPAWEDDEDEHYTSSNQNSNRERTALPVNTGAVFSNSRKAQFEKVVGTTPSWAQLKSSRKRTSESEDESGSDKEEEDKFLRRTGDFLTTSELLPKSFLKVRKVTNANKEQYTKGRLSALEFHPTSQVVLTAGEDQSLHIFQVDGQNNPKIQSVAIEQFPITNAHFSADGTEVIVSSRSRWYYVYDMIAGKLERMSFLREYHERQPLCRFTVAPDGSFIAFQGLYGFIHLVSAKNKELICSLKMNGSVSSLAFSGDGSKLFSFGDDGEVYIWDMKTRDCIHKFVDDGCIKGTTISVSRDGQYLACGSSSGVVNIYDSSQCLTATRPKPLKAVMNLTTSVTAAKFNCNSEILGVTSFHTQGAVKLIHLPDCHVFANFPLKSDSIGLPVLLDFSPSSGYMAVGNSRGKALLYRLGHYKNY